MTGTIRLTYSPTVSFTASNTPAASRTPTTSNTPTPSWTASVTFIPSFTYTITWTLTPSPYVSPTDTLPPTSTFTFTSSFTPSVKRTTTNTPAQTATFTVIFTPIPSRTRTPTPPGSGCVPQYNGAYEDQMLVLINNERAKAGLSPLQDNYALETSAGIHSLDQSVNNFLSHTGSDGSSVWDREVRAGYTGRWGGEIIYAGNGNYNNPTSAVKWWMNDPPHRNQILGDYQDFGAGYVYCSTSDYGAYFTIDFGHR